MKLQEYKTPERKPNGHDFNLGCNKKLETVLYDFFFEIQIRFYKDFGPNVVFIWCRGYFPCYEFRLEFERKRSTIF